MLSEARRSLLFVLYGCCMVPLLFNLTVLWGMLTKKEHPAKLPGVQQTKTMCDKRTQIAMTNIIPDLGGLLTSTIMCKHN